MDGPMSNPLLCVILSCQKIFAGVALDFAGKRARVSRARHVPNPDGTGLIYMRPSGDFLSSLSADSAFGSRPSNHRTIC